MDKTEEFWDLLVESGHDIVASTIRTLDGRDLHDPPRFDHEVVELRAAKALAKLNDSERRDVHEILAACGLTLLHSAFARMERRVRSTSRLSFRACT